jgi:hypothetical protein
MLLFSSFANAQTMEISIVTDWETVSHYGSVEETQIAIDSVVEYADVLFNNQLNIQSLITFVDIPATESEDTIANHTHAISLMDSLFEYVIAHEEHYYADIVVMLTKRDIAVGSTDYVGYAKIKSVCTANSLVIVELYDNGLDGSTLAHELAHVLGAVHDGDVPCESTPSRGYLMSSSTHTGTDNFSQCSIDTINSVVATHGYCLYEDNTTPVVTQPPIVTPTRRGGSGSISIIFIIALLVIRKLA